MQHKVPQIGVTKAESRVRNTFDLGGERLYTTPVGMLLPVFTASLNAQENVRLKVNAYTQGLTLKGRAFTHFRERFATFFVKYSDMWTYWRSFISNLPLNETTHSSKFQITGSESVDGSSYIKHYANTAYNALPTQAPCAQLLRLSYILQEQYYFSKLLDLDLFTTGSVDSENFWKAIYYAYGYYTVEPDVTMVTTQGTPTSDGTLCPLVKDDFGIPINLSAARLIEHLEYGSIPKQDIIFRTLYDLYLGYKETGSIDSTLFTQFTTLNYVIEQLSSAPIDLGSGTISIDFTTWTQFIDSTDSTAYHFVPLSQYNSLFRILAYQKIYQDAFRIDDFEPFNVLLSNLDCFFDVTTGETKLDISSNFYRFFDYEGTAIYSVDNMPLHTLLGLLTPRYAHFNKDVANNIKGSPLYTFATPSLPSNLLGYYGGLGSYGSSLSDFRPQSLSGTYRASIGTGSSSSSLGTPLPGQLPSDTTSVRVSASNNSSYSPSISPQSLRALFALEKLAKLAASAKRTYESQIAAIYGTSPSYDNHTAQYVGSVRGDAAVTPVIAMADGSTDDSQTNFGQQSGYLDGVTQGTLCDNFQSPDFGELITFHWLEMDAPFDSTYESSFNGKLYPSDFFHPQFADLGLQPLFNREVLMFGTSTRILGFQPRYSEYKLGRDVALGQFRTNHELSFMTCHRLPDYVNTPGELNSTHNVPYIGYNQLSLISPLSTNPIVEVEYDGTEETDPLYCKSDFTCYINRNMSVNGEPLM